VAQEALVSAGTIVAVRCCMKDAAHFRASTASSLWVLLCLCLAACSTPVSGNGPTSDGTGRESGGQVDSGRTAIEADGDSAAPVCGVDAAAAGLGSIDATRNQGLDGCPAGWCLNSGVACGPPGTPCSPIGDGRCYELCGSSDDCSDPCAPSCDRMFHYQGSDTAKEVVPVCLPGTALRYPAVCAPALKACWSACKRGGPTTACAAECRDRARGCATSACDPPFEACKQRCVDMAASPDAADACAGSCVDEFYACLGPL
jgi:hypothetical protein